MFKGLVTATYIVAAVLFIFSLAKFSKQETSKKGNNFGIAGMAISLIATILGLDIADISWVLLAMMIGGLIGIRIVKSVNITEIPELLAILHSFVGLVAVLIGLNSYLYAPTMNLAFTNIHLIEVFCGIFIGSITITGSIAAFLNLQKKISLNPFKLPTRNEVNFTMLAVSLLLLIVFVQTKNITLQVLVLLITTIISLAFGWNLVASISGSDMPVVISMLNSYSGWAGAATGFMLSNDLLIITGALVGSSGAILSYMMCKAMNRSFINVITGNCNRKKDSSYTTHEEMGEYNIITPEETAEILKHSNTVIITPGYGMAVSQAQYPIAKITEKLQERGIQVRFGIHPVAGRLPGHMNVLLAEAKIPYSIIFAMDEINDDFSYTDTVLVIGANDTVNPSAQEDLSSPIAGMPVMEVWKARKFIVFKRSINPGYSGIQNPLFFKENAHMLFGDAKSSADEILKAL